VTRRLKGAHSISKLADRLSQCPQVTRFDSGEHREAASLAYAFSELEESFDRFTATYFPALLNEHASPPEIYDVLHEVGEELRHILYHITQLRFYGYLRTDDR
jgi:hypothetical protein